MKLTVIGTGYVGLVTGACLAEMGNHVVCLDVDERKIKLLQEGGIPIHEPGLDKLVQRNSAVGRLQFTTDIAAAVGHGTLLLMGVGTPPGEDGSADLHVLAAADPVAMPQARQVLEAIPAISFVADQGAALIGADALLIVTEWREFRSPDFEALRTVLKQPLIFDGRNLFEPEAVRAQGIEYHAIGRGASVRNPN